ncbi:hypothetical protein M422DRAFT_29202 [Sphaerobolus stellatus SS14]|uniref:Uncharacterized protein n=1 Tax=Sphaerobolus stellatus (strain SS14) TaxID=990650 RepID=A0A0C9W3R0_SPHS4|nr:hypothetical protein M422DRAFT_29202 [Sphaerobolus stellatus SS14]
MSMQLPQSDPPHTSTIRVFQAKPDLIGTWKDITSQEYFPFISLSSSMPSWPMWVDGS